MEIFLPKLGQLYSSLFSKKVESEQSEQWILDSKLDNDHTLYEEYIELAIQFGFITLFSTAFPLAPLCALINNLFEIRVDAQKYTRQKTRPIPTRFTSILSISKSRI